MKTDKKYVLNSQKIMCNCEFLVSVMWSL